jgi:sulfide:quinone oxidoreductase
VEAAGTVRTVVAMTHDDQRPLRVLVVGGGVAGLEAILALRDLAGDRVAVTLLTPDSEFVYRPLRVREPFAYSAARQYSLEEIARDLGAELKADAFKWLEPERQVVHTSGGEELEYDALLLALGARPSPRFKHAVTLDDRRLDEQLHGLIQDVEAGYARKVAFIAPGPIGWPLPVYELALMTARRAWEMQEEVSITLVTPERMPLEIFGGAVSEAVERLLVEHGILVIPSAHCETPEPGHVAIHPGGRTLQVDRIVALPELFGPATPGIPKRDGHGFIPTDAYCRVSGLERVFAAGDATDFPIKLGGLGAQQADVAAQGIAALAGVPLDPSKLHPVMHGMLIGGDQPLYLSAHVTGAHGSNSEVSTTPTWSPATKIAARYLAPYLDARDNAPTR